jgi:hypothetical protein
MKKLLLLFSLWLLGCFLQAQDSFTKTHGLRAMGTLAPGFFTSGATAVYFAGDFDYYLNERISVNGEGHYFLSDLHGNPQIINYHALLAGVNYHFTESKQFDPFIGMQPGLGLVEGVRLIGMSPSRFEAVPLLSFCAGTNFYVGSIFHFFVKVRYLQGHSLSATDYKVPLGEFRLMAGLGFNVGVRDK